MYVKDDSKMSGGDLSPLSPLHKIRPRYISFTGDVSGDLWSSEDIRNLIFDCNVCFKYV